MTNNFIHLHTHSDHSPLDGAQSIKQIVQKAKEFGMDSVAITDHGKCSGLISLKKECKEAGISPIYGIELYVAPGDNTIKEKIEGHAKTAYHLTVLAKNQEGLRNIFRLTSDSWINGFYYKPRTSNVLLKKHSEGLVVLSGCGSGRLCQYLMAGQVDEAEAHIKEYRDIWGDDFYLEAQNHGLDWQLPLRELLFRYSEHLSIPIVATQDSHYLTRNDADLHRAICKLSAGDLEFEGSESYFKPYEDMCKMFTPQQRHAIDRTQEVANKCKFDWDYGKTIWPVYDLPAGEKPEDKLTSLVYEGFKTKFGKGTKEYRDRLEHELDVIKKMGFSTYFLVVQDFLNWARSQKIPVGLGRGSAAGSLVCYCIGITEVDPIKYGLYFQRFLNESRISLPDVDSDICRDRRGEVIEYVINKYGKNKVSQIGTSAVFKPRGSLRAFARVLGKPISVGDYLASLVPPDDAGKALTFDEVISRVPEILNSEYSDVVSLARAAEKLISQNGVHAAGVVISDKPLTDYAPLFCGRHEEVATQFDMHGVEDIGLVKYDFLGLKNLTSVQETLNLIKERHNIDINLSDIDLDDQRVYKDIFHKGDLAGVFQFETSSGFKELCIKVHPESIKDLAAISSLYRPGPIGTGLLQQYVDGRNGKEIKYLTPKLEPILKDTFGVIVFQEQLMRICIDLAGYSLSESDNVRKIVGKKERDKMILEKDKFVSGCVKNNISQEIAEQLFQQFQDFAKYSFNLAHATAYSILSYRTAWLKRYYPLEFYCALFNCSLDNQDDLVKYFHAAKDNKIDVQPPDINISSSKFTIHDNGIVFGLAGIKGLGEKACQAIVESKPDDGFSSIEQLVRCGINRGAIKALIPSGALSSISDIDRDKFLHNIDTIADFYEKLVRWEEREESIKVREQEISDAVSNGQKPPRRLPKNKEKPESPMLVEVPKEEKKEKTTLERESLGFYLSGHPIDRYSNIERLSKFNIDNIKNGEAKDGTQVSLPAVVFSIEKKQTKKKQDMAVIVIEDRTGRIEVTIFPSQWKKSANLIHEDVVYMIHGVVKVTEVDSESAPIVKMMLNSVQKIDEDTHRQINPIVLNLADRTTITIIPSNQQDYTAYQRALSIANNMKKMEI